MAHRKNTAIHHHHCAFAHSVCSGDCGCHYVAHREGLFMKSKKTSILCIAPYNNPHIIPIYDEIAARDDVDVTRVSMQPLDSDRLDQGWPEMAEDAPYLQPWRRTRDWFRYVKSLLTADVVVSPGVLQFRTLPLHHWLRRLTGKPTLLWSEAFRDHPRAASRGPIYRLVRRLLCMPCNSPRYTLLCIGHDADRDFYQMGMSRWNFRRFAYAVQLGNPR